MQCLSIFYTRWGGGVLCCRVNHVSSRHCAIAARKHVSNAELWPCTDSARLPDKNPSHLSKEPAFREASLCKILEMPGAATLFFPSGGALLTPNHFHLLLPLLQVRIHSEFITLSTHVPPSTDLYTNVTTRSISVAYSLRLWPFRRKLHIPCGIFTTTSKHPVISCYACTRAPLLKRAATGQLPQFTSMLSARVLSRMTLVDGTKRFAQTPTLSTRG